MLDSERPIEFEAKFGNLDFGQYVLSKSGVAKTGKQNESISVIPIAPTAILHNVDSHTEKVELSYYKFNRWKNIVVDRAVTANRNSIIRLADKGVEVNSDNAGKLVKYIADAIALNLDKLPYKDAKTVMGWNGLDFMPYTDELVFDGEDQFKFLYAAICSKGNLLEWINFIRPYRSKLEIRLCMAAAFASPLIELVGANSFVFHLWGKTGTAKTVALLMAMSIYGDPSMGKMTRTMNMTANSMLGTAAFFNNLPFAGDELQTIKSRWTNYDNLIMAITEGIDRARMKYDQINETRSWKCAFLFTGEEPCTKENSGGGVRSRVIEVEVRGKMVDDGNAVANFVRTNYGGAGPLYIKELQKRLAADPNSIIDDHRRIFRTILDTTDTTDKQAASMALILLADQIASGLFWPEEKPLELEQVRPYMFTVDKVDASERAYQFIVDTIGANPAAFTEYAKELWGRIDRNAVGPDTVFINRTILANLLQQNGFDFASVKRDWLERGYLILNSQKKYLHDAVCFKSKGRYVKLRLPPDESEPEADEELPF